MNETPFEHPVTGELYVGPMADRMRARWNGEEKAAHEAKERQKAAAEQARQDAMKAAADALPAAKQATHEAKATEAHALEQFRQAVRDLPTVAAYIDYHRAAKTTRHRAAESSALRRRAQGHQPHSPQLAVPTYEVLFRQALDEALGITR